MPFHAVNPAAFHSLSPRIIERAVVSAQTCNSGGELRASCEGHANSNRAAFVADFRSLSADENFAPSCVCRYVSRLLLGHCFGAYPAPCGSSLFCFGFAPYGLRFPYRTLRKCRASALGSRALSLGSARCDPSKIGKFNKRRPAGSVLRSSGPAHCSRADLGTCGSFDIAHPERQCSGSIPHQRCQWQRPRI
jgi:hypothetical protein